MSFSQRRSATWLMTDVRQKKIKIMKCTIPLFLLFMTTVSWGAFVSVFDAIKAAEDFFTTTERIPNEYHITSVILKNERNGEQFWHVRYDRNSDLKVLVKGDWFIVVVDRDLKCGIIFGK